MPNDRARELRKRLTPQEVKLWVKLRGLKPLGFHFRRQAPIGAFIVDFACLKHRLIIEADGGQHGMSPQILKDSRRDDFLKSQRFRVLRFWNSDIDHHLDGVIETIVAELKNPHPDRLTPVDPPHKGEG
jgi:very-short-patch-repair endonuclease